MSAAGFLGRLCFDACRSCRHYAAGEGGCGIDDQEWRDLLEVDSESGEVSCGAWEAREASAGAATETEVME